MITHFPFHLTHTQLCYKNHSIFRVTTIILHKNRYHDITETIKKYHLHFCKNKKESKRRVEIFVNDYLSESCSAMTGSELRSLSASSFASAWFLHFCIKLNTTVTTKFISYHMNFQFIILISVIRLWGMVSFFLVQWNCTCLFKIFDFHDLLYL